MQTKYKLKYIFAVLEKEHDTGAKHYKLVERASENETVETRCAHSSIKVPRQHPSISHVQVHTQSRGLGSAQEGVTCYTRKFFATGNLSNSSLELLVTGSHPLLQLTYSV